MENKYNITDAELEIMKELWENKQLSLNELTEKLNKKEPRNKNTIKTLLYRLIEKGAVKSINKNQKENEFKANNSKQKDQKKEKQCFLNKVYNGEFEVNTDYTQAQLEDAIQGGKLVLHNVNGEVRILTDVNSLVTTSDTKGEIFKNNQTVRVADQIANDVAVLFNTKYLGNVPNNESGRISLWADIVKHHENLQEIGAIEEFKDSDVEVNAGETKTSVAISDVVTIINAMEKLYMTVKLA